MIADQALAVGAERRLHVGDQRFPDDVVFGLHVIGRDKGSKLGFEIGAKVEREAAALSLFHVITISYLHMAATQCSYPIGIQDS